MLKNLQVKQFLSRIVDGNIVGITSTIPFYPTIDVRLATTSTKTADYTITQADLDLPTIFDNTGDTGTLVYTLPAAKPSKGKVVRIYALAAQIQRLLPQTGEAVNNNGNAVVTKYLQLAGVIGTSVEVYSDGTQWIVTHANGVVTKEA